MLSYIIRRILLLFPTLLGVLAVVFFVMAFSPGGFGGTGLNADGAQTEGEDAKRARKALERRYGLDLPKVAQFGRWLNQVSPVGFRMSGDVKFTEEERDTVQQMLAEEPFNTRPTRLDRAVNMTQTLAAYTGLEPEEAAQRVKDGLKKPSENLAILELIDASMEPVELERLEAKLVELESADSRALERAQNEYLQVLAFEASGRSRIRFDRPAFKAPDLGQTLRGRNVGELLLERVPVTLLLNLLAIPLIYVIAITSGIYAARHKGGAFDLGSGAAFLGLWSVPQIWAGVLLITYFANQQYFRWFPAAGLHDLQAASMAFFPSWGEAGFQRGWLLDSLWHLVLPVACMAYGGFAVMSKVMRGAMLENLSADFVRTARAKGVAEGVILWRHAFRNSVLPLITMVSGVLPALFVGAFVVETIFSINGLGKLGVEAAFQKDRELVMATTLIGGLLGLTSELVRDICYAIADPRVSYD
ncbi:ABC transporter permease [Algisphaera agarilytica]|uniref:Peptide/nickel transport system permease protein n=1 Tax=Algisphaera agarilytica TaxID=1385975 RepID=A0A7X0LL36_9BACT|nr:ABC transporter permease [Algisphaera agarilytica]MBB6430592.1 peptide/nickel transport system permease protein [Algisphaera agarilytica]